MFSRGLMSWGEGDWLATRVDKWVAQCHGYSKLRSRRLSRGCQTMLDRPSPTNLFWSRSDAELLNDLTDNLPETSEDNVNISALSLEESNVMNGNDQKDDPRNLNFSEKQMQYDQDIADYIAYLNKPVINMNDHYIEIHQYHYEPSNLIGGQIPDVPIRPPTRRKKHKIDMKKTEIVENKGISTIKSPVHNNAYSEFLVKKSSDTNQSIKIVSGRSSDEENKNPTENLDQHRPLTQQSEKVEDRRVDTVVNKEGHVKVKRGQTFSIRPSDKPTEPQKSETLLRGFMSFRTGKKNKSGRRKKKVVVGEEGINGPIWPAVLLTFDRSISPGPPESPDESEV